MLSPVLVYLWGRAYWEDDLSSIEALRSLLWDPELVPKGWTWPLSWALGFIWQCDLLFPREPPPYYLMFSPPQRPNSWDIPSWTLSLQNCEVNETISVFCLRFLSSWFAGHMPHTTVCLHTHSRMSHFLWSWTLTFVLNPFISGFVLFFQTLLHMHLVLGFVIDLTGLYTAHNLWHLNTFLIDFWVFILLC